MPAWTRIVAFAVLGIAGFAPTWGLNEASSLTNLPLLHV